MFASLLLLQGRPFTEDCGSNVGGPGGIELEGPNLKYKDEIATREVAVADSSRLLQTWNYSLGCLRIRRLANTKTRSAELNETVMIGIAGDRDGPDPVIRQTGCSAAMLRRSFQRCKSRSAGLISSSENPFPSVAGIPAVVVGKLLHQRFCRQTTTSVRSNCSARHSTDRRPAIGAVTCVKASRSSTTTTRSPGPSVVIAPPAKSNVDSFRHRR